MRTRGLILIIIFVLLIVAAVFAGKVFGPGPMAFAGGSTAALADYRGADPTGVPADLKNADVVTRGKYLARAADCMVCHTAPDGAEYAGGLAFPTPFGTLYSTNITPDKETGVGNYTDQDFLNAVQRGVRPDGTHLYPAMPFPSYTYMTDHDALAIKAYLFSLAGGACRRYGEHASLSVQPALADGFLVCVLQRRSAVSAQHGAESRMEQGRVYRRSARALRRMPHAAKS